MIMWGLFRVKLKDIKITLTCFMENYIYGSIIFLLNCGGLDAQKFKKQNLKV